MRVLLITLEPKIVEFVRGAFAASGHEMTHLERAGRGRVHAKVVLCGPDVDGRASRSLDPELRS